MKADTLRIQDLQVSTRIGVYEWEKQVHQTLVLDLDLHLRAGQVASAARRDELAEALDYTAIAQHITEFASQSSVQLLETFAERLVAGLLAKWPLESLRLSVHKPAALPGSARVSLVIERYRNP